MKKGALAIRLGIGAVLLWTMTTRAADKATFVGTIINDKTDLPVGGAKVAMDGVTCTSDYSGNCRIPGLEPDYYHGMVSKLGYNNYYF